MDPESLTKANDSSLQLDNAVNLSDDSLNQSEFLMPPPALGPAGDTPYNFPKWSVIPMIRALWLEFQTAKASADASEHEVGRALAKMAALHTLNRISGLLQGNMPSETPLSDQGVYRLYRFCHSFSEVMQRFCAVYNIPNNPPSLFRHKSIVQRRPAIWKAVSKEVWTAQRVIKLTDQIRTGTSEIPNDDNPGESTRFDAPDLTSRSARLDTVEKMTEFLDDSQEATDGSSDLQITGKH